MTCHTIQDLMLDYAEGTLDGGRRALVQSHLGGCPECARTARALAETRGLLRALPPPQTSAQFEARLAERLAQVRRPAPSEPWWGRLRASLALPSRALRPALALGAAVAAVAGTLLYQPWKPAAVVPPIIAVTDAPLVSQCVAQHQRAVATQPLSDPAAQNLTARLSDPAYPSPDEIAEENL